MAHSSVHSHHSLFFVKDSSSTRSLVHFPVFFNNIIWINMWFLCKCGEDVSLNNFCFICHRFYSFLGNSTCFPPVIVCLNFYWFMLKYNFLRSSSTKSYGSFLCAIEKWSLWFFGVLLCVRAAYDGSFHVDCVILNITWRSFLVNTVLHNRN